MTSEEEEDVLSEDSFLLRVSDECDETMRRDNADSGTKVLSADLTERKRESEETKKEKKECEKVTAESPKRDEKSEETSERKKVTAIVNGESDNSAPSESRFRENLSRDRQSYSGHFGNYSISEKLNAGSKPINTVNSTSEKYYNQNAHYGPVSKINKFCDFKSSRKSRDVNKSTVGSEEKMIPESSGVILKKASADEERIELPDSQNASKNGEAMVEESKESRISEVDSLRTNDDLAATDNVSTVSECHSADSTSSRDCRKDDSGDKNEDVDDSIKLSDEADRAIVESSTGDESSTDVDEVTNEKSAEEKEARDAVEARVENNVASMCMEEKIEESTNEAESLMDTEKPKESRIIENSEPEVACDSDDKCNSLSSEKNVLSENDKISTEKVENSEDEVAESEKIKESVNSESATKSEADDFVSEDKNLLDESNEQILIALDREIEGNKPDNFEMSEKVCQEIPPENDDDKPDESLSSQPTSDSDSKQAKDDSPIDKVDLETIDDTAESNSKCPLMENEEVDGPSDNAIGSLNDDEENKETSQGPTKRTSAKTLLEEAELPKRMRTEEKMEVSMNENAVEQKVDPPINRSTDQKVDPPIVDNAVTNKDADNTKTESDENVKRDDVENKLLSRTISEDDSPDKKDDQDDDDSNDGIEDCEVIEVSVKRKLRRSRRSLNNMRGSIHSQENSQEKVRQKRRTAQNAEEMIRKELFGNTDSESNDSMSKFVMLKASNSSRATSPPTLKRTYVDDEEKSEGTATKKLKPDVTSNGDVLEEEKSIDTKDAKQTLRHVRAFFRRDSNGILSKVKQEELEELLIQKIVETLTMRDEIGRLREQARASERNLEATRLKYQQAAKQVKDFEMVLNRYKSDLRANPDSKTVVPIKINRSVGLQVHFISDHGIQNLRQLQHLQKVTTTTNGNGAPPQQQKQQQQQQPQPQQQNLQQQQQKPVTPQQTQVEASTSAAPQKRTIKIRSPRRQELPVNVTITTTTVTSPAQTVTPAALVSKPVPDSRPSVTVTNQQVTAMHPQLISSNTILVNGNIVNQSVRQSPTVVSSKTKSSDLIDLTQEEEKIKAPLTQNTILTAELADPSNISNVKITPRFHTVIQTIPSSVAITPQQGIRVVQPSSQPTPTALVNNMNAPRLTYVTMQNGIGSRQVVLTSAPAQIRSATTNNIRTTFPISGQITNSGVRVIPATGNSLMYKHPAPLPESLNTPSSPAWKLPPPAPSLKISKKPEGIVLSWNMALSDKYADIASYQLYAYQEISGVAPSSSLWKKVGDVMALQLPMACTLTQFSRGNTYYFAVRAVDKHSRLGQYSQPGNISL